MKPRITSPRVAAVLFKKLLDGEVNLVQARLLPAFGKSAYNAVDKYLSHLLETNCIYVSDWVAHEKAMIPVFRIRFSGDLSVSKPAPEGAGLFVIRKKMAVVFGGTRYPSLRQFCETNDLSYRKIYKRLESGQAIDSAATEELHKSSLPAPIKPIKVASVSAPTANSIFQLGDMRASSQTE